jgi:hypothetical protein
MSATLLATIAAPAAARSLTSELQQLADQLRRVTVRIATTGSRFDGVGAGIIWPSNGRSLVIKKPHLVTPRWGVPLVLE